MSQRDESKPRRKPGSAAYSLEQQARPRQEPAAAKRVVVPFLLVAGALFVFWRLRKEAGTEADDGDEDDGPRGKSASKPRKSVLPRHLQSKNRKGVAAHAAKAAPVAREEPKPTPTAAAPRGKGIPPSGEVMGGEAGSMLTTHSTCATSAAQKRVSQNAAADKALLR